MTTLYITLITLFYVLPAVLCLWKMPFFARLYLTNMGGDPDDKSKLGRIAYRMSFAMGVLCALWPVSNVMLVCRGWHLYFSNDVVRMRFTVHAFKKGDVVAFPDGKKAVVLRAYTPLVTAILVFLRVIDKPSTETLKMRYLCSE